MKSGHIPGQRLEHQYNFDLFLSASIYLSCSGLKDTGCFILYHLNELPVKQISSGGALKLHFLLFNIFLNCTGKQNVRFFGDHRQEPECSLYAQVVIAFRCSWWTRTLDIRSPWELFLHRTVQRFCYTSWDFKLHLYAKRKRAMVSVSRYVISGEL